MRILKNAESLEVVERVLTAKRKINIKIKPEIEIRAISAPNFYLWFLCHFWWFV